jgi:CHRD domain
MKKVLASLTAVVLLGALVMALSALAGATPGKSTAQSAKTQRVLFALLKGRNEIDATTGKKGAGDPDGRGGATVQIAGDQVCFGITVDNLATPVAAHIHAAGPNRNGPIVVTLAPPAAGDPGASSGCATVADAELLERILNHPNRFYVNVHTGPFPNGAVRGQLKHRLVP